MGEAGKAAGVPAALAALCLLSGAAQAQQSPETSSRGAQVRIQRDSAADRVVAKVYEGRYSFVRIESREPGADTNAQPLSLSPQALRALLGQVQIAGGKPEPLFSAEQLDELAAPLSQALARADAGQDVSIAAADRFGEQVRKTVERIRSVTELPLVVYPNGGGSWDAEHNCWHDQEFAADDLVAEWLDLGVRLLGGCCGYGPSALAALGSVVASLERS